MLGEPVLLGAIAYENVLHVEGRAFMVRDLEGEYIAYIPGSVSDYLAGPDPFVAFFDVAGVRLRHTRTPDDEGPALVEHAGVRLHGSYVLIDGLWTRHTVTLFEGASDLDQRALCVAFLSLCSCGGMYRPTGKKGHPYCDRCGVLQPGRVVVGPRRVEAVQLAWEFA